MKTILDVSESETLLSLGIPKRFATKVAWQKTRDYKGKKLKSSELKQSWNHGITDKPFTTMTVGLTHFEKRDIFTVDNLLGLFPEKLNLNDDESRMSCFTTKRTTDGKWMVCYSWYENGGFYINDESSFESEELIDALYECLKWIINNGYLKIEE